MNPIEMIVAQKLGQLILENASLQAENAALKAEIEKIRSALKASAAKPDAPDHANDGYAVNGGAVT